ncbi:adenosine deaminase-like protein [Stomoxys calcitrans]|uniref:adenosine deaminase-like protein n=1 Tax=Stomoxys calcitrans TaxID=35570 RepID=UPI0027E22AA3|nr:adenosine deaminase-like protein [Stomoxys calcitrans]
MDLSFLKTMPKVELHAHLNGSLKMDSIQELGMELYGDNSDEFLREIKHFVEFASGNDEDKLNKCFQKFQFMHKLTATKEGLELATEKVIRDFASDNVFYLELRTTPKANSNMSRRQYIEIILHTLEDCLKKYDIIVKLLVSIDRSQGHQVAEEIIDLAIEMRNKYPSLVKGIDLSGNPAIGCFEDFVESLQKAKNAGLKLALHCAEIDNEMETQEMLDFNFDRCGHGTFLTSQQVEQCKKQLITIECCLTSNVKCGTVKGYDLHHFKYLFENKVKAVICTDDCGVFDSTLTEELLIACRTYGLNKEHVYGLSKNAIEASFASKEEKQVMLKRTDKYFKDNQDI